MATVDRSAQRPRDATGVPGRDARPQSAGWGHRYKRAGKPLWIFCGSSGGEWLQAATALAYMRDRSEERDWWAESARRRDQT